MLAAMLALGAGATAGPTVPAPYINLTPIITMPSLNLGTCCGSSPDVGLDTWLDAGGIGIDTAFGYGDQANISRGLAARKAARSDVFILSKIDPNTEMCTGGAAAAVAAVKANNALLATDYTDITLIHWPCKSATGDLSEVLAQTNGLWAGLMQAKALGLTRAIGVSDFNVTHLAGLKGEKPALHQHSMSMKSVDTATLDYSLEHDIWYEAFSVMRGCPFTDPTVVKIAAAHGVGPAQVCVRWTLQRGAIAALGTGKDASKVGSYTKEDLDVWDFALTDADMVALNALSAPPGR